jgi:replication-associated recombination protein RarA
MMLVQAHTRQQLDRLLGRPTHGILLCGPDGSGKTFIARQLASSLLGTEPEKLDSHPYFKLIAPANTSLSIDQIREAQKFLQLKTPGRNGIRRVIVIKHAHLMTTEAQNALLKSLEEPPADTVLILTAPATKQLKDTIYSRVQQVTVLPVTKDQARDYFKDSFGSDQLDKAFMMSGGLIGLLHALLRNEDHSLVNEIKRAKEILAAPAYSRLIRVDELAKQKESLPSFLQACKLICTTALEQAAQKGTAQTKRWHHSLDAVYQAEAALPRNPNTKLLLTDLFLNL